MKAAAPHPMTSRERFRKTMAFERPDRLPCFEEGLRPEVLEAWSRQGMPPGLDIRRRFPVDRRLEIEPDLEPHPPFSAPPWSREGLSRLRRHLDSDDPRRLPKEWSGLLHQPRDEQTVRMLRVHRGFFLSMGIRGWDRFRELMEALGRQPDRVAAAMRIQGDFCARLTARILGQIEVDAAIFSEPIGGNDRPLISPQMYTDIVLDSYEPILKELRRHGVRTVIFRTYANARILIPRLLERGIDCLWACEVNVNAMDYRALRRLYGRRLGLIGGIDLDALRRGRQEIAGELEEKLPPLLAQGGYIPLADGRVRADVPYDNYVFYRRRLEEITGRA